jgi:sigma-E factor negative regulatory protein RseB
VIHRSLTALALAGACSVFALCAHAQPPPTSQETLLEPREVRAWLMRIHAAANHHNFQGTFVVSAGGSVSSARIAHYCDGRNQFERVESLDGETRRVYRHNNTVHTLWPKNKLALVEQRELMSTFPALLQGGDDRIVEFYDVRSLGNDRVAGHEVQVLQVRSKDPHRFGYRLWAERNSGLLLRAEVIGERDAVIESSAFSDVVIGVKPQPENVLQPMLRLDGYRVLRPALTRTRLDDEGWSLRPPVAGFRQVSCVKRPLDRGTEADRSGGPEVLQSIYSDGLTYVSVFIEPFNAARHVRPLLTSIGATQTMTRRQGDWWVTVVGDVPVATLKMFVGALERKK